MKEQHTNYEVSHYVISVLLITVYCLSLLTGKRPWWRNSRQVYPHRCDVPHYIRHHQWNKEAWPTSDESIRDSSGVSRTQTSSGTTSQNREHWSVLTTQCAICDTTSKISVYSTVKHMPACHNIAYRQYSSASLFQGRGVMKCERPFHLTIIHSYVYYMQVCLCYIKCPWHFK
jgi:hypothetical protein